MGQAGLEPKFRAGSCGSSVVDNDNNKLHSGGGGGGGAFGAAIFNFQGEVTIVEDDLGSGVC